MALGIASIRAANKLSIYEVARSYTRKLAASTAGEESTNDQDIVRQLDEARLTCKYKEVDFEGNTLFVISNATLKTDNFEFSCVINFKTSAPKSKDYEETALWFIKKGLLPLSVLADALNADKKYKSYNTVDETRASAALSRICYFKKNQQYDDLSISKDFEFVGKDAKEAEVMMKLAA